MPGSVIVAGARTPIGKMSGALTSFTAMDLGGVAIKAALERAGIAGDDVDFVYMGQVLGAGQGQMTARQAAVKAGIPMTVPATTINKVCLSGLNAVILADQLINAGEADVVVAGGMESMTNAPHLLPNARAGYRIGDGTLVDSMMYDGLTDAFDHISMGLATDRHTTTASIDRAAQDEYSARSHERAAAAMKDGRFDAEITPVEVPQRKGDPILVTEDEGVRPGTTAESLGALRPAFDKAGTITAGNASQISDGAGAMIVMSRAEAERRGCTILAEVLSYGMVAGPDNSLLNQPSRAILKALGKIDKKPSDVGLYELNEAFASVAIASTQELGISEDIVNVDGGAIALGHPIGASGARVGLHAILELQRRGGGLAAAALCGGGGQGDAVIFKVG
jgi:acetyl-CoA C-acetyltransferase